ncbi:tetrapeptide repeat homeobox protein 2 [Equus asinus]|uniref:tetrapeptide repeat homeobox protein 2 n=1 Tax=Equus asinus TaxID=9793 RepID=UPI0038F7E126
MQEPGSLRGPPPSPRPPRRPRQERTVYSKEQQQELESSFQTNKYPTYEDREALAARLALQERQVQVWFKNRRAKESRPRGHGARAVPRGPGAPAPPRVPVPVPAGPPPPEGPGLCSPPPPSAASIFPPAEPSICSPGQAWWGPAHGAQDVVPAAPAPAPAWPHDPYASDFSPDPVAIPDFTALFSPRDPCEGPAPSCASGSQKREDSADAKGSGPARLQDL